MVTMFLGFISLCVTGMGYGFKKSWLLWLAIPFWVMLIIWISYSQTWFEATAQHSLIFIAIPITIALGFSAVRMQLVTLTDKKSAIDDVEENGIDEEFKEYMQEREAYNKESKMYHTKTKPRRPKYF